MKTEKEVRDRLKTAKKYLREASERFEEYDNHEDMEAVMLFEREIKTLEWVLNFG